jgi:hypothetical protein
VEDQHVALAAVEDEFVDIADIDQAHDVAAVRAVFAKLTRRNPAVLVGDAHKRQRVGRQHGVLAFILEPAHQPVAAWRERVPRLGGHLAAGADRHGGRQAEGGAE